MAEFGAARPVDVNGATLAAIEKGEGDAVVFVHGSASDLRTWSAQVEAFSDRRRAIAYSRRFHRPNAPIPADAADPINTHVDDLAELIRVLDARPAHVVGHSWGGLVSLLAAGRAPDMFRSLVLIEPPVISMHVSVPPKPTQMIRLLFSAPALALAIAKFGGGAVGPAEKAFRRGDDRLAVEKFGRGVLGDRSFEALSEERYAQAWDNRGPDRALALHHGFPDLMGDAFPDVRVPVLIVGGADSPRLFQLLNQRLLEKLPGARLQVIDGASHIVHEDAPEALNEAIRAFHGDVG